MKKVVILLVAFLLLPLISSQIIINQQPNTVYNLGDVVNLPITIKSQKAVSGFLQMDLICEGKQENFYKNGVNIPAEDEKKIEASLVLTQDVIGNLVGKCRIKIILGSESLLTNEFKISDWITIITNFDNLEFSPGEVISVSGDASKEDGNVVSGLVELSVMGSNSSKVRQVGIIDKGSFSVALSLPEDMKAGAYLLRISAYEQDLNGLTTNRGSLDQNILVRQIPTSLEIILRESEVEPGTNLSVKAVLHDQTGEKISSQSFISIKNGNNKILEQVEVNTDEFHEFPIAYNEPPSSWKIVAVSNRISNEATLTIMPKESINVEIVNTTITITNTGNVPYNKTALVKIGNESINLDVYLNVGKSQSYFITAPNGNYDVQVTSGRESATIEQIALTGKTVDVKKASGNVVIIDSLATHPFIWIFVAIIIVLGILIFFKKRSRRSFFGNMNLGSSTESSRKSDSYENVASPLVSGSLINSKNKAEISISMKGEKQDVCLVALSIKNLAGLQSKDGGAAETLQKVVNMAEDKRAATYEDNNFIIFILSPSLTKTSENEKTALEIAQSARETLAHHNKMFKQKMNFGISIGSGSIVAKYENHLLKFSSIDSTISSTKKVASLAEEEVLLGEKMNDKLRFIVKSAKHNKSGTNVYSVKEVKNVEEHAKFLKSFSEKFKKENKTE